MLWSLEQMMNRLKDNTFSEIDFRVAFIETEI